MDDGIYEANLQRAVAELRHAAGIDDKRRQGESTHNQAVLELLLTNAMVRSLGAQPKISRAEIERSVKLARKSPLHWKVESASAPSKP